MKRSPLKRKTALKRSPMRRGKRKGKYASRDRAPPEWFAFTKSIGCAIRLFGAPERALRVKTTSELQDELPCDGPMEANHMGERIAGLSTKSRDRDCAGMCKGHHGMWTEYRGLFAGMTHGERREYAALVISAVHERAGMQGVPIPDC